ncbi:hypothetical protein ACOSQ2_014518 [Xanthoceras sorbifolium]
MKKKGFSQSLGSLRFLSLLRAISDFSWASLVRENSRRRINHVFLSVQIYAITMSIFSNKVNDPYFLHIKKENLDADPKEN